jgi:hypothetical protein
LSFLANPTGLVSISNFLTQVTKEMQQWASRKPKLVALITAEAEYIAACDVSTEEV